MEAVYIGYHGSTKEVCDIIYKDKKFIPSKNSEDLYRSLMSGKKTYHWLGKGIYFWNNNIKRAREWADMCCSGGRHTPEVIEVQIKCESDRVFDLCVEENYNIIYEIVNRSSKTFKNKVKDVTLKRTDEFKHIGAACDFIFNQNNVPFDLICFSFSEYEEREKITFFPKMASQICVKNDNVIEYDSIMMVY